MTHAYTCSIVDGACPSHHTPTRTGSREPKRATPSCVLPTELSVPSARALKSDRRDYSTLPEETGAGDTAGSHREIHCYVIHQLWSGSILPIIRILRPSTNDCTEILLISGDVMSQSYKTRDEGLVTSTNWRYLYGRSFLR